MYDEMMAILQHFPEAQVEQSNFNSNGRWVGYDVEDLGIDCQVEKFDKAVEAGAKAVLCSCLTSLHVEKISTVVAIATKRLNKIKKVVIVLYRRCSCMNIPLQDSFWLYYSRK